MPTAQQVEERAAALDGWATGVRVDAHAMPGTSSTERAQRARDLTRATQAVVSAATAQARQLAASDEERAARTLDRVEDLADAMTWRALASGTPVEERETNALWRLLMALQTATGDVLPPQLERAPNATPRRPLPPAIPPEVTHPPEASTHAAEGAGMGLGVALLGLWIAFRRRR